MAGTLILDTIKSSTANPPAFQNTSGTEIGQLCRAWVNFNGTTSPGTIRASFNVSSVTKNGTGDYTVNFTNALTDANYAKNVTASGNSAQTYMSVAGTDRYSATLTAPTTSAFRMFCYVNNTAQDAEYVSASIFR